jgi:hypothetical protein
VQRLRTDCSCQGAARPPTLNWRSTRDLFQSRKAAKTSAVSSPHSLAEVPEVVEVVLKVPASKDAPGLSLDAEVGLRALEEQNDDYDPCPGLPGGLASSFEAEERVDIKLAYFRDLLSDMPVVASIATPIGGAPLAGQKRPFEAVENFEDLVF